MSIIESANLATCRKARPCEWCGETIDRGSERIGWCGKWEGEISRTAVHPECWSAWQKMDAEIMDTSVDHIMPGSRLRGCTCEAHGGNGWAGIVGDPEAKCDAADVAAQFAWKRGGE